MVVGYKIKWRLKILLAELNLKTDENLTLSHVARQAGINYNTLNAYSLNKQKSVNFRILGQVLEWFNHAGMDVGLDDLFEIEK